MLRFAALGIVLLSMPIQDPPKTAYFSGPAGAKETDLKEAAKALLKRCESLGWKGMSSQITTRNGKRLVALTCETGFPIDRARSGLSMHRQAERLAYLAALDSFELRFVRPVATPAEMQQYRPGKTPDEDVAPKGTSWVRFHRLHAFGKDSSIAALLFDEPVLRKFKDPKNPANDLDLEGGGFRLRKSAFEKVKKASEKWEKLPEPTLVLLIDGRVFDGHNHFGSVKISLDEADPRKPYLVSFAIGSQPGQMDSEILLKHPSPIPLTLLCPGFLGIEGEPDKAGGRGILITKSDSEGAAERGGLKVGDVIFSIGTLKTDTLAALKAVVSNLLEGDEAEIIYLREGTEKAVNVILGGRKD